jgi:hypothetical protein
VNFVEIKDILLCSIVYINEVYFSNNISILKGSSIMTPNEFIQMYDERTKNRHGDFQISSIKSPCLDMQFY